MDEGVFEVGRVLSPLEAVLALVSVGDRVERCLVGASDVKDRAEPSDLLDARLAAYERGLLVEQVLRRVQQLDPLAIASRNLAMAGNFNMTNAICRWANNPSPHLSVTGTCPGVMTFTSTVGNELVITESTSSCNCAIADGAAMTNNSSITATLLKCFMHLPSQ